MKKLFFALVLLGYCCISFAYRVEYGGSVIISQPVQEDLYIAGGTVTINAPVYGDLVIAGGTIIINDSLFNDLLMLGGDVTINGFVGDDIRCAGGQIHITRNVKGDVVVTGGTVTIDAGVTIGSMMAGGGNVTVGGSVNGDIRGAFGELVLNGPVANNIDCRGGRITVNGTIGGKSILAARHISIGNNAVFNNDVRYWNNEGKLDFKQSLKNGKAAYDPALRIDSGEWYYLGAASILGLLWYLGMALLMIVIVQYLFSATMKKAADTFYNNTLKALGSGFLFFVLVPVAAVIAFVTVIGVPVGLLLLMGYVTVILLSTVITSVLMANWYNNRNNHNWHFWKIVFSAFGVFVLLKLFSLTPFVGWLIMSLMVCISFGAIILNSKWKGKPALAAVSEIKSSQNKVID